METFIERMKSKFCRIMSTSREDIEYQLKELEALKQRIVDTPSSLGFGSERNLYEYRVNPMSLDELNLRILTLRAALRRKS